MIKTVYQIVGQNWPFSDINPGSVLGELSVRSRSSERRRPHCLGLDALGFFGRSGRGALAFLDAAVRSHGKRLTGLPPAARPVFQFDRMFTHNAKARVIVASGGAGQDHCWRATTRKRSLTIVLQWRTVHKWPRYGTDIGGRQAEACPTKNSKTNLSVCAKKTTP
jgi:hypothetical protein